MDIHLRKWGNSLELRIPHRLVESFGWDETCTLELQEQDDALVIRKKPHVPSLDELLASIPDDFQYPDDVQDFLDTSATGQELL